jgi:hypothetical protein
MAGSTISSTVTSTVTLGSAAYPSPLIITNTGDISPAANGAAGIVPSKVSKLAVSVMNAGVVSGGGGSAGLTGSMAGSGGSGGFAVDLAALVLTNSGLIAGGNGGNGGMGYSVGGIGGSAGIAVSFATGSLTNSGTIVGGNGGTGGGFYGNGYADYYGGKGGVAGIAVALTSGSVINDGMIAGGNGGGGGNFNSHSDLSVHGGSGSTAGIAVKLGTGELTNYGTIAGGTGGKGGSGTSDGGFGGDGGSAVSLTSGSLINEGTIAGGDGGLGGTSPRYDGGGGFGGTGVVLATGSLTNDGRITGGASQGNTAGTGVYIGTGYLANRGTIIGGIGVASKYYGYGYGGISVSFHGGGTLINAGFIGAGVGAYGSVTANAVQFGSGASRLVLDPAGRFSGAVVANANYANMLELAAGTVGGTLIGCIGAEYRGFAAITVDADANWVLSASNTIAVGGSLLVDGSLTNAGTIAASNGLPDGGSGVGGMGGSGVQLAGSLTNNGTIDAGAGGVGGSDIDVGAGGIGGVGVNLITGMLTNDAVILGGTGGTGGSEQVGGAGGSGGAGVNLIAGSLSNDGTMIGGRGGDGGSGIDNGGNGGAGGSGGYVVAGELTNEGTIIGGMGGAAGPGSNDADGAGGVGVLFSHGGTLIDAGFIGGGSGTSGIADAVYFGTGAATLVLDPRASFNGAVVASSGFGNILDLVAGAETGTITGLGDSITGFGTILFDAGAGWLVAGNAAGLATGQTIDGFTSGETIELTGFVATDHSFDGAGLVLSSAGGAETIGVQGSFATGDFNVFPDAGNSFVEIAAPCFVAGTRISAERGEIAVESLRVGDKVNVAPATEAGLASTCRRRSFRPRPALPRPVAVTRPWRIRARRSYSGKASHQRHVDCAGAGERSDVLPC